MTKTLPARLSCLVPVAALLAGLAGTAQATLYNVAYDGNRLDVTGFINANSTGTFSPTSFNAVAFDYSINVVIDNTWSFTFNTNDSTWGDNAFGNWGSAITIQVTANEIQISSASSDDFSPAILFLMTDTVHNGALENLRISGDRLGIRPPNPSTGEAVSFDSGRPIPFATAVAVPEPSTYAMLAAGLVAVIGIARRRRG